MTVGDPSNAADTTGYGAVNYEYRIGKYEVTIGQYCEFLNAVDPSGNNPNGVYDSLMGTYPEVRGISFAADAARGSKYSVIGSPNRPMSYVSWYNAARFANWMSNGQGAGSTETGAYTLHNGQTGPVPVTNKAAAFYIPTENEWYKAAFYSPTLNSGAGGYYLYATQSNLAPGNQIGGLANQANYFIDPAPGYSVTQRTTFESNQNYLSAVGAFSNSASYYGTFDQSGNLNEFNSLDGSGSLNAVVGWRGGYYDDHYAALVSSSFRTTANAFSKGNAVGFRLAASIAPVPEPSTWALALAGIACGSWALGRRTVRHAVGRPRAAERNLAAGQI